MGSPASIFANQPVAPNDPGSCSGCARWWLNIFKVHSSIWGGIVFGYRSPKGNGDARHAHVCSVEDLCVSGVNTEY